MKRMDEIPVLPARPIEGHKGTFGKVLIIGGSWGFSGAPALAGRAALRSGSGLVRVAIPESILPIVASLEACYTTIPLPEDSAGQMDISAAGILERAAAENDVLCFGPGAGTGNGVKETLLHLIGQPGLRMILDADGLNVLAKTAGWMSGRKASVILTPHPGELKRIWGSVSRGAIPEKREEQAARLAELTGGVVVLKGAGTVVADSERVNINTTGNPGMATAGTGDVLSGIITALAGQGMGDFEAAVCGVYVHGKAGDLAAREKGQISLIATDVIDYLPAAFQSLG